MSERRVIYADEIEPGAVIYLVEDTSDGPRRTPVCECVLDEKGAQRLSGHTYGDDMRAEYAAPDDGRRVEWTTRAPGFRAAGDSWLYGRWLVIDTETTGLDDARIVELGAVIMQDGEVLAHRSSLFNPGKPIDPRATEVHGIRNEDVAHRRRITEADPRTGRTPAEGLDRLAAEWDVRAVVGYNAITFDLPILRRELGQKWEQLEASCVVVDPLVVVRLDEVGRFWKGAGRHKLTSVADRFQLTSPLAGLRGVAHRATWDCVLAGRVLWHLREHLPLESDECTKLMRQESAAQQRNFDSWKAKQPAAEGAAR